MTEYPESEISHHSSPHQKNITSIRIFQMFAMTRSNGSIPLKIRPYNTTSNALDKHK